jgi:hypothetical protein
MRFTPVKVHAYSGYKANEKPLAFEYQNQKFKIDKIIDQWYEGGVTRGRTIFIYFKILTLDGIIYFLRYDPVQDSWELKQNDTPN